MGTPAHGVAIFAEALGEDEAATSTVLTGKAGRTFNRLLTRTEDPDLPGTLFKREDFLLGNVINCRPPDNHLTGAPWEDQAIRHCSPYLLETLQQHRPKVILAMGNQPLRRFTGQWGIDSLRGYVFDSPLGVKVIGTYHPSYIQRGHWEDARVWQLDLQKAISLARGVDFGQKKSYLLDPSPDRAWRWMEEYEKVGGVLSFDIETPWSKEEKDEEWTTETRVEDDPSYNILRISFSYKPFEAISFPFEGRYKEIARRLLAFAGPKLVWNQHFDVPRLEANGCPVKGRLYDGMDAWHFLEPSLRMGLKYVATFFCPDMHAWKLESREQPAWYNAADSDTALRCFLATRKRLEATSRWEIFERHVVDLTVVLRAVTLRGINVDIEERKARREEFGQRFDKLVEELQPRVPLAGRPLSKPYTLTEEELRKRGLWEEGKMRQVKVRLTEKQLAQRAKKEAAREKREEKRKAVVERKAARALKKLLREAALSQKGGSSSRGKRKKRSGPASDATTRLTES